MRHQKLTGIEELLAMAAADGRFAAALLRDRPQALAASGAVLSPVQQRMLASIDEHSLRRMILGLAGTQPEQDRRVFIARAAVALAALAAGVGLGSGGCHRGKEGPGGAEPAPVKRPAPALGAPAEPEPTPEAKPPKQQPGHQGLDTVGTGIRPATEEPRALGSGGYTGVRPGQIHGRLGGRSPVRVKAETPGVKGGLSTEIVRRIIRRHVNELRYCYQKELQKKPDLAGTLKVTFSIAPTGQVARAALDSTTMGNAAVESCAVAAVKRWLFPRPKDGKPVQVFAKWTFWQEKKKGK